MDCLFCRIAQKNLPTTFSYEDDLIVAFADIAPAAPIHQIIIPKVHIPTLNEITLSHVNLLGKMMVVGQKLAAQLSLAQSGYRFVMNCNQHGGQSVFHIHLHLLGGRQLSWPPG